MSTRTGTDGTTDRRARRGLRLRATVGAVALVAASLSITAGTTGPAQAADPKKALVNSEMSAGAEGAAAAALGFDVTTVDGPTWSSMSPADFGAYDVLILGDPYCGPISTSVSSSIATWGPVVLGQAGGRSVAGNRVVIGTDPVLHAGSFAGANVLISDGIDFAGSQPGRTGLYFDTSCGGDYFSQEGLAATMLASLSTGGGAWTENDAPPCGGSVAKIASTSTFDSLHSSDIEGWGCSVHETFPTFTTDWHPLAVATDAPTNPVCGIDAETTLTACGEPYILIAGSDIVVTAPDLTLTPATSSDPAGGTHTVTATLARDGAPIVGQKVTFDVTGVNVGVAGTCSLDAACFTDSGGQVSFTYPDTNGVGDDTVSASFTDNGTLQAATAAQEWTAAVAAPTTTTYTGVASVQYSDSAALSGTLKDAASAGVSGKTLGFALGTQSTTAGPTSPAGTGLVVNQLPGSVSTVATTFAGDATHAASSDSDAFSVTKEDCTLAYSGDTTVLPTASTVLAADLGELDASLGDRSGKTVTFTVTDASLVPQVFTAVTDAAGHAATTQPLAANVYGVAVAFAGDGYYKACTGPGDTLVTVEGAGSKTTGGGWFVNVSRTGFGLNLIPEAGGLWKGQLQLRAGNTKDTFHGNTAGSVSSSSPNTVTWSGTGRWNRATGYGFTVTVQDNGTSGKKGDTINVRIYKTSPPGTTVYSTSGAAALKGGNIVVH